MSDKEWLKFSKRVEGMDLRQLGVLLGYVMQRIVERSKELRK